MSDEHTYENCCSGEPCTVLPADAYQYDRLFVRISVIFAWWCEFKGKQKGESLRYLDFFVSPSEMLSRLHQPFSYSAAVLQSKSPLWRSGLSSIGILRSRPLHSSRMNSRMSTLSPSAGDMRMAVLGWAWVARSTCAVSFSPSVFVFLRKPYHKFVSCRVSTMNPVSLPTRLWKSKNPFHIKWECSVVIS